MGGEDPRGRELIPYRALVRLRLDNRALCTAVHVGGGRLLTAKHGYDGERRRPRLAVTAVEGPVFRPLVTLEGDGYDVSSPTPWYRETVRTVGGRSIEITQPDIGLVTPRRREDRALLTALPRAVIVTAEATGDPFRIAGFGNDHLGPEDTSGFGVGRAHIPRVGSFFFHGRFERGEGNASPSYGDSGGPLFRLEEGVPHVYGISSLFEATGADRSEYDYVKLSAAGVREWLTEALRPP